LLGDWSAVWRDVGRCYLLITRWGREMTTDLQKCAKEAAQNIVPVDASAM
jgi:hypothetical protein